MVNLIQGEPVRLEISQKQEIFPGTPRVLSSGNPADKACSTLRRCLWRLGYGENIIAEILDIARQDGDLTEAIASGRICPEDADSATEAFVGGFAPVGFDADSWDDEGVWMTDAPMPPTEAELAAVLVKDRDVPSEEDSAMFAAIDARYDVRGRISEADWDSYRAWAEWHELTFQALPNYDPAEIAEIGFRAGHPA